MAQDICLRWLDHVSRARARSRVGARASGIWRAGATGAAPTAWSGWVAICAAGRWPAPSVAPPWAATAVYTRSGIRLLSKRHDRFDQALLKLERTNYLGLNW